jgi:hypothetical protein
VHFLRSKLSEYVLNYLTVMCISADRGYLLKARTFVKSFLCPYSDRSRLLHNDYIFRQRLSPVFDYQLTRNEVHIRRSCGFERFIVEFNQFPSTLSISPGVIIRRPTEVEVVAIQASGNIVARCLRPKSVIRSIFFRKLIHRD